MIIEVHISTIFECSLERAWKTPMLCDITKVHTGYGLIPKVTHTTNDQEWGRRGSSKRVHVSKTFLQDGGFAFVDRVVDRVENQHWKIQIDSFQTWMAGFSKFVGEWDTTQISEEKILVQYRYSLHSNIPVFYPMNWLFGKILWRMYMKRVVENVRRMAYAKEPYLFA